VVPARFGPFLLVPLAFYFFLDYLSGENMVEVISARSTLLLILDHH
jgi:hypothetical protein